MEVAFYNLLLDLRFEHGSGWEHNENHYKLWFLEAVVGIWKGVERNGQGEGVYGND